MPAKAGVIPGKLSVVEFGRQLLEENDLDPLYTMLHTANLPPPVLARYILSYLCFYDTGTAAWITDQAEYWCAMETAGASREYMRRGDRRHFRAKVAQDCIDDLSRKGKKDEGPFPQAILNSWSFSTDRRLDQVMGRIQKTKGFGPTMAFKTADMLNRLWGCDLEFSTLDCRLMPQAPKEGAEKVAWWYWTYDPDIACEVWAHCLLIEHLGDYTAPPTHERKLSVLETETILCKWNHYLKGSYSIGKGKESQREGLLKYPDSPTARKLLAAGAEAGLWR